MGPPLSPRVQSALVSISARLREQFGLRLRELRLFGSQARNEARGDSDVDVLVVIDGALRSDFIAVTNICGDLLVEHAIVVDPYVVSTDRVARLRAQERRLIRDIDREGMSL